jgi:hypothetical protein
MREEEIKYHFVINKKYDEKCFIPIDVYNDSFIWIWIKQQ